MDLRQKKTRRSIQRAFLQLRRHKPPEHIRVKELTELAEISKATFYLHYRDIYDLNECMQNEVIAQVLEDIPCPEAFLTDQTRFLSDLIISFQRYGEQLDLLFSKSQSAVLPLRIDQALREYIFRIAPERREDIRFNILLTYQIQGGFYAYQQNKSQFGEKPALEVIQEVSKQLNCFCMDVETHRSL